MTKQALGELILQEQETMWRVSVSLLKEDQDRYDAIQNAIIKAFEQIRTLHEDRFARTWLVRILINECHNIHRHQARLVTSDGDDPEASQNDGAAMDQITDPWKDRAAYMDLHEAIRRLPEELRLLVTLYYVEGFSVKEIAKLENIPPGTVKSRLARARTLLRDWLDE